MDKELRILILEDVPAEAELEEHELKKAGLVFTSKVVDTRETFLEALDEFMPDIILSDYELPSFDGLAALRIVKEKYPYLPFILVTGKMGEEFAIEKLKEGVTDYVLKNNLKRLAPAVQRALKEAEEMTEWKQAEKNLQDSEERFRVIFDNASDGILLADPESKRFYLGNKTICHKLGYSEEEIKDLGVYDIHPLEAIPYVIEQFEKQTKREIELAKDIPLKRKDKSVFYADINSFSVKIAGKQYIAGIFRDITERKLASEALNESEHKLRNIIEHSNELYYAHDVHHVLSYASPQSLQILGYTPEEMMIEWTNLATENPINEKGIKITEKALKTGKKQAPYLLELYKKDRSKVLLEIDESPIKDNKGEVIGIVGAARDITEQKKSEEALRENEERLESIFRASPTGIGVVSSPDRILLKVNERLCKMLGYSNKELVGKNARMLYPTDEDFEYVGKRKYELLREHGIGAVETRWQCRDGRIIDVLLSSSPIDKNNFSLGITFTALDITDKKGAEEALKKSKEQIHMLLNSTAEAIYGIDLEGKCTFVNAACLNILGYDDKSQLLGKNMHSLIHAKYPDGSEYPEEKCKIYQAFQEGKRINVVDEVFWKADGNSFPVEYWSYPIKEEGKVIGAVVTFLDITDRRAAEEELKKHQKELQKRVKELEEFYEIAIGRELRMKDLKEQIVGLEKELAKYKKQ